MTVTPLGAALRALLLSDPAVQGAVGERVAPQALLVDEALPALTYLRIGGGVEQEHEGLTAFEQAEVQIDAWAATDEQAEVLGVCARAALVGLAPMFRHQGIELDSIAVLRDRGTAQDKADKTDDAPTWRYSFDVVVAFRRLPAA